MKAAMTAILLCVAFAVAGCGDDDSPTTDAPAQSGGGPASAESEAEAQGTKPSVSVPDGAPPKKLVKEDLIVGDGTTAEAGDEVTVQYVGVGFDSKEEFDASWDRGEPFTFQLGGGMVIKGWDQGVEGMQVGGRRELVIPPNLAYGPAGSPPAIGPNETLVFVVDLLEVE